MTGHGRPPEDRRIQKTRKLLLEALFSLIREKPFDSIAVKEILDRANVGRSTFYMHFRDKQDLLVSGMHDLLGSVQTTELPASGSRYERMIGFSLPLFEHIQRHRQIGKATMGTRGWAIIHEHLQKMLAERIADHVGKEDRRNPAGVVPAELLVQFLASTFILVLNWWVDARSPLPAKKVNEFYRALVLPALGHH